MRRRSGKTIILYAVLAAVAICIITQYCKKVPNGDHRKTLSRILGLSPEVRARDGIPAGIAWLMTFPNSGTTFTLNLVQKVSQTSAATNYGHERIDDNGNRHRVRQSILLDADRLNGPFRLSEDHPLNDGGYTLSKTHCGGYCFSDCPPNWYRMSPTKFLSDCGLSTRHEVNEDGSSDRQYWVQYEPQSVSRIVHLMRDPFDNIVSRWNHEKHLNAKNPSWKFEDSIDGFRAWCENTDRTWKHHERNIWVPMYGQELYDLAQTVPCHKEFMQYVLWHNNAFELARAMELPHLLLHYEDFYHNQKDAALKLLSFLELPPVNIENAPKFRDVTHYLDFYTPYFQRTTAFFLKSIANIDTWLALVRRYPYLSEFVKDYHRLQADALKRQREQMLQQQALQEQLPQMPQDQQQPKQPPIPQDQQEEPNQTQMLQEQQQEPNQPQISQQQQQDLNQPIMPQEQQQELHEAQSSQQQQLNNPQIPQDQQSNPPSMPQRQQQQQSIQEQRREPQEQQKTVTQPLQEPPREPDAQGQPDPLQPPPQEINRNPQPDEAAQPEVVLREQPQQMQLELQPVVGEQGHGEGDGTGAAS